MRCDFIMKNIIIDRCCGNCEWGVNLESEKNFVDDYKKLYEL